jgi:hypothetical protein
MNEEQRRIQQAKIYDERERAADHGIGHPGGPTGLRKPRAPQVNGNADRMRQLRKHHPELHSLVMDGKITVGAAMSAAKRPRAAPTITRLAELELWLGTGGKASKFANDDQRRAAWFEHRDRLMGYWARDGRRPMGFWWYEAPFKYPGFHLEKSTLWTAGLLGAAERRQLEQHWLEEFNRSLAPDFTFNGGLTGRAAHIAALVFCDCPAALAERWAGEAPEAA